MQLQLVAEFLLLANTEALQTTHFLVVPIVTVTEFLSAQSQIPNEGFQMWIAKRQLQLFGVSLAFVLNFGSVQFTQM